MDNKDAILKLIAEILELLRGDDDQPPHNYSGKRSWIPGRPRNGSARELLALVLGILLGLLGFSIIKGCTIQNACIIKDDTAGPAELLEALGDFELDAGAEREDYDTIIDTDTWKLSGAGRPGRARAGSRAQLEEQRHPSSVSKGL